MSAASSRSSALVAVRARDGACRGAGRVRCGGCSEVRACPAGDCEALAWREAQQARLDGKARRRVRRAGDCAAAYLGGTGLGRGFLRDRRRAARRRAACCRCAVRCICGWGSAMRAAHWRNGSGPTRASSCPGLSLALMALLLALSANVGVGTMVEGLPRRRSRRGSTNGRTRRNLFRRGERCGSDARSRRGWAGGRRSPPSCAVWKAETRIAGWPVDVFGRAITRPIAIISPARSISRMPGTRCARAGCAGQRTACAADVGWPRRRDRTPDGAR